MNIYSKIQPDKLLHAIIRKRDIPEGRMDVSPNNQFLQCATLRLRKDTTFKPHKHNWKPSNDQVIAQESWIIIKGLVKVTLYDLDDTVIHTDILQAGEASFTFEGGHTYLIMSEDAHIFEYKTGPYIDQQTDKTFIN